MSGLRGSQDEDHPPGHTGESGPNHEVSGSPPSSLAAGDCQELQGAMAPSSPVAEASWAGSEEGAQGPEDEIPDAGRAALVTRSVCKDPQMRKASMVMDFLLERYTKKEPITQNAMLKVISRKYEQHFPEILSRASELVELVFGLELKEEVDSTIHSYDLVSKLNLPNNGRVWDGRGLPKTGLLMTVLGVIFVKGNCAAEEDIWKFLNMMRVYAGRKHFIYGEPRKLITKDFVTMKYLEYRQVANSDPPCYEFLWGPRAHVETSKMKVLEFLAKVNDTVPGAFSSQYEEALRDEEERARATASAPPRAKSCSSSHI
uniref:MAGE domain-containing protein n=1 Tax=Bos indicus x Bos taurus TaxID=30522 RepID=A0A4W2I6Z8_BOBOX